MYGKHVIFDGGEIREEPVTNEWLLGKSPQCWLTVDRETISANGLDTAIITIQRVTVPLLDGSQNAVYGAGKVVVLVDGEAILVELDENGTGTLEVTTIETGKFQARVNLDTQSNVIEITGV